MNRRLALPAVAATLAVALAPMAASHAAGSASAKPAKAAAAPRYTVTTLDFHVTVPNEAVGGTGTQSCLIVGDLYRPAGASAKHRVPAILTTNGFGGSKADQDYIGELGAERGYAVLSYSGLGFGGSGCKISLDDPSYDGRAGKQLISFLGGKKGIATRTGGAAYPAVKWIVHDKTDHKGHHDRYDPRVGMVGGSYGGQVQFAVADKDPRLDTIVPIITWNDLSYSLAPNNTGFTHGVTYSTKAPGTDKLDWSGLFFGEGIADGLQGASVDPSRDVGCVNFVTPACKAEAELASNTLVTPDLFSFARHASVESYMSHIKIPTLLAQGEADTLFNLQEATATYKALHKQGTPVKMIWQSWGHSDSTPAKGEFATDTSAIKTYEGKRVFAWFAHYLKGEHKVSTGPRFAYYRDWVPFSGSGPDTVQYATSSHINVGRPVTFYASGASSLVRTKQKVATGSATYTNLGGGVPESYSETSAAQSDIPDQATPPTDAPGSFASFKTAPLTRRIDVAGIPTATLHLSAPTTSATTLATELQLFVKVYDVAPDGTVTLVHRLISPVRVLDASKPVHVQLPGIVHRFAKGHTIELVIAATDGAYRNASPVQPVTVSTSPTAPTTLTIPVVK
ncbi:MAG TPA: CocE/NonD family hydrolase [Mycobacteriales bacterium]|jgi:ABC-2 type transport system ATP-binding protein|nr:CocE/NonD family hydrolase [Mycobacteriales bacterium]